MNANLNDNMDGRVLYFAYGSNMLTKRMRVNAKSAVKYANGVINNYKLVFSGYANLWKGTAANIVSHNNACVWGVIWKLNINDIELLDKQEIGYNAINIDVLADTNDTLNCRTYVQKEEYAASRGCYQIESNSSMLRSDCLVRYEPPSAIYKAVILKGANEHKLPQHYIDVIQSFADNGIMNAGPPDILSD